MGCRVLTDNGDIVTIPLRNPRIGVVRQNCHIWAIAKDLQSVFQISLPEALKKLRLLITFP